ncbi:MAG: hypothetical protein OEY24_04455 [Candidatus Bathyarchaeota archaeon]|nr:hypothetical protein [Candidatus Bathyarchaeota archaeon]MDH5494932.1 hypothetical protein [Candidatus Bathyarchaeota archaeon]
MKWKILFCAFLLIATAAVITAAASPILTVCSNLDTANIFDFDSLLLDGGFTPTGGGDPVPGGGIPK